MNIKDFNNIPAGTVFAKGEIENSPKGIYMTNNHEERMLRWIAKKGYANDWVIYCHWADSSWSYIEQSGDKVTNEANIKKLISCDDETFKRYRL
jgi:hypothetical protein